MGRASVWLLKLIVDDISAAPHIDGSACYRTSDLAADLDPNTWWKPVADDPTENFWVELDLGRAVIADKIRVTSDMD